MPITIANEHITQFLILLSFSLIARKKIKRTKCAMLCFLK